MRCDPIEGQECKSSDGWIRRWVYRRTDSPATDHQDSVVRVRRSARSTRSFLANSGYFTTSSSNVIRTKSTDVGSIAWSVAVRGMFRMHPNSPKIVPRVLTSATVKSFFVHADFSREKDIESVSRISHAGDCVADRVGPSSLLQHHKQYSPPQSYGFLLIIGVILRHHYYCKRSSSEVQEGSRPLTDLYNTIGGTTLNRANPFKGPKAFSE